MFLETLCICGVFFWYAVLNRYHISFCINYFLLCSDYIGVEPQNIVYLSLHIALRKNILNISDFQSHFFDIFSTKAWSERESVECYLCFATCRKWKNLLQSRIVSISSPVHRKKILRLKTCSLTDRYIVFLKGDKSIKCYMMDALGRKDDERRDWLRKASVRCQ